MIATLRNIFGPRRAVPGPVTMVPPGQRAYAIGDIHGRADLFEAMIFAIEDDDKPRKKVSHEIGQDLSLLSVEELAGRIALMQSEIERLQAAMTKKRASKDAANSFFKT